MHEDSQQAHQARLSGSSGNHALSAGTRIDTAEITGQIGSSPAAIVYLAREATTNRRIALREYMPHGLATRSTDGGVHPSGNAEEAVYAAGLRSFINEALVLSRLSVPSLLNFERYLELNGTAYAFMPYHEGSTLDYAVTEEDFAPDEVWIRMLVMRLLDAAEAVQRAQSCHGNIRPGNILIRRDGTPLLLEFDAAQATIGEIIHTPTGMLATGYAAMEQHFNARDRHIGAWTDIYGIGATAYFLVTGHPPPYAMQRLTNEGMLPALHAALGGYSRGLLSAIGRALAVHPERRFQTAAEMRAALSSEPQIVMPASPSVLRSDNARAAAQANRETTPVAANSDLHQREAEVQRTQINSATAHAELPPLSQIQAHSLPALSDDWRKPVGDHGYRGEHSRKRRRTGLWASSLMLLAGVSVGLGAGYMHLVGDGNSPQAEAAADKPQDASTAPDSETKLATAAPAAVTEKAKAAPASTMPQPSVVARPAAVPAADAAAAAASAAAAKPNTPAAVPATAAKMPQPSTPPANASETDKETARLAAQEQEQWRIASYVDQAVSYETYLKRYPGGRYAAAAREKLASLQRPAVAAETSERAAPAVAASSAPPAVTASAATAASTASTTASAASAARADRADKADARSAADEDDDPPSAPAPVAASGNSRVIRLDGQTMTGSFAPDPSTGAVSGSGRIEWSNGDRFDGTLVRGSKEGKGQFVWRSGQRYSGDWAGNEPNGRGTIVFANGNRYDGEVRNGIPNGKGKLVFADKTRYEGEVRGGVPNGKGTMTFPDGTRYEGDVRNGVPHGQGVTRFKNGDVYVGAVAQGRSNGHGRFSWSNGTAWEGEFRDGQRTENGRMLTAMSRAAMSSGGSPGGTSDGGVAGTGRNEIVTK